MARQRSNRNPCCCARKECIAARQEVIQLKNELETVKQKLGGEIEALEKNLADAESAKQDQIGTNSNLLMCYEKVILFFFHTSYNASEKNVALYFQEVEKNLSIKRRENEVNFVLIFSPFLFCELIERQRISTARKRKFKRSRSNLKLNCATIH